MAEQRYSDLAASVSYWIYYKYAGSEKMYCSRVNGSRMEWSAEEIDRQLALWNSPQRTLWFKEPVNANNY